MLLRVRGGAEDCPVVEWVLRKYGIILLITARTNSMRQVISKPRPDHLPRVQFPKKNQNLQPAEMLAMRLPFSAPPLTRRSDVHPRLSAISARTKRPDGSSRIPNLRANQTT